MAELDAADADLVIFLGDMIYGPDIGADRNKAEAAIRAIVEPVAERGIPFAVTFGNHDDENCISKEEQLQIYQSFPGCLNDDPELPGVGNTCLELFGWEASEPSIRLWLLDSGTYAEKEIGGYGYVTEEQNAWIRAGAADAGDMNGAVSYVFQHIPVRQVFDLLEPASPFEKGAFCTYYNPFSSWYKEKENAVLEGRFAETPCPPNIDSGEFQAWKDIGVKAAFFGHDHVNDFVGTVEGIDLIGTCGIGFYSYGRGDEHGARLLVLHTDRPAEYETEMVYYRDLFEKPLSFFQVPHMGVQIARIVILFLAVVAAFVVFLVMMIRRKRKRRAMDAKTDKRKA